MADDTTYTSLAEDSPRLEPSPSNGCLTVLTVRKAPPLLNGVRKASPRVRFRVRARVKV